MISELPGERMGRRGKTALFLALIGFLGVLHGWNLSSRGILSHDEGHALLYAHTIREIIARVADGSVMSGHLSRIRDVMHREGGTLYSAGKTGYGILLGLAGLSGGVSTRLGLWLAWLSGMMTIFLAARLAWLWSGGSFLSLTVAAWGIGLSRIVGELGREVSGTTWAVTFSLAALVVMEEQSAGGRWGEARRKGWLQVFAGILAGFAFICHFNIAPFLAAMGIVFLLDLRRKNAAHGGAATGLAGYALMLTGFAGFLAAVQVVTFAADWGLSSVYPKYMSFGAELVHLFTREQIPMLHGVLKSDGVIGWSLPVWKFLGSVYFREGIVFLAGLCLAAWWTAWTFRENNRLVRAAVLFLFPTLFWMAYVYKVERVQGMCVTAGWIAIACCVGTLWEKRAGRTIFGLFLGCVLVHTVQMGCEWNEIREERSVVPGVVKAALDDVSRRGGLIDAASFDVGFAPVWKWSIVEALRSRPNARTYVDFSSFQKPDIVFTDPWTWDRPNADFHVTRQEVDRSRTVARVRGENPDWTLSVHDLRE